MTVFSAILNAAGATGPHLHSDRVRGSLRGQALPRR